MSTRNRWITLTVALLALAGSGSSRDGGAWSGHPRLFRPVALGREALSAAGCTAKPRAEYQAREWYAGDRNLSDHLAACDSGAGLRLPPAPLQSQALRSPVRSGKQRTKLALSFALIHDLAAARSETDVKLRQDDPDVERIRVMVDTAAQAP